MDHATFDHVKSHILDRVNSNLQVKGEEYATEESGSRFHNFEVAAAFNGVSTEMALWGMATKHLVSLSDMVKEKANDFAPEVWDEKIGDAITYLVLLRGVVATPRDLANIHQSRVSESWVK